MPLPDRESPGFSHGEEVKSDLDRTPATRNVRCRQTPTAAMVSINRADLHRQIDDLPIERLAVVERSPDVLGGLPVFCGTRVPVRALLDYLAAGDSLDAFLDDFPSVGREQAIAPKLTRELMPS